MKVTRKIRFGILLIWALLLNISSYAQFPYVNSFKQNDATGIIMGGTPSSAILTGNGIIDPNGDGYLRLTNAVQNQTGYAYIDTPFPSEKGITVEFEYFSHSATVTNSAPGADGISFFLFDANVLPVEQGRFGGSLGYAQYRNPNNAGDSRNGPGMNGGFLAIGLDEYGNWATQTEDRNGGIRNGAGNVITAGQIQGNGVIAIRGAIDPSNPNNDGGRTGAGAYPFIDGKLTNNLGGGGPAVQPGSSYLLPSTDRFSISTNARGPLPADANYRKVIIDIQKNSPNIPNSGFTINVKVYVGSLGKEVDVLTNVHYPINDADIPANLMAGFASSTGNSQNIHEIRNLIINAGQIKAISLVKTVSSTTPVGGYVLGSTIDYTFKVKNEGTEPLNNVHLTDYIAGVVPVLTPGSDIGNDGILSAGEEWTYTASYTVAAADIIVGKVSNTAKVTSKATDGSDVEDDSGTNVDNDDPTETTVGAPAVGEISLVKTANAAPAGGFKLNDVITYTFKVKNEGNVALNTVSLTDNLTGVSTPVLIAGTDTGNDGILSIGEEWTYTATYTITQADVDAGKVSNTAKVTSKDPSNNDVEDDSGTSTTNDDPTETPVVQTRGISLVKTASTSPTGFKLNDVITYTFVVKNEGTVTLKDIVVADPLPGLSSLSRTVGTGTTLAPGSSWTYTATYTIKQSDVDAGKVTNQATVNSKDPSDTPLTPVKSDDPSKPGTEDPTEVPVVQTRGISLVKTASTSPTGFKLNDVITYTFIVKNEGTVTLKDIVVADPLPGLSSLSRTVGTGTTLAPGASWTYTATYTIKQSDVDAGKVTNQATVNSKDPSDTPLTPVKSDDPSKPGTEDPTEVPVIQTRSISLVKTANTSPTGFKLNDVITYTFVVKNEGTVTLKDIVVADPLPGLSSLSRTVGTGTTLAPGASWTYTATYTINQSDVDAGKVTNQATVNSKDPSDTPLTPVKSDDPSKPGIEDPTEVPVVQTRGISLEKTASTSPSGFKLNDVITYTFVVKNEGTVTLKDIVVADPLLGLSSLNRTVGTGTTLAPGSSWTYTATYTIKQSDVDAGKVTNQATVNSKDPSDTPLTPVKSDDPSKPGTEDPTEVPVIQTPAISLVKTASVAPAGGYKFGTQITYTFIVKNEGTVTLKDVVVTDPMPGLSAITRTAGTGTTLVPGASWTYTATYTITQPDVIAGKVVNHAMVTSKDPVNNNVSDDSGTAENNNTPTEITVTPNSPVANDDSAETEFNKEVKINLAGNDQPDGIPFDLNSIEIVSYPAHGTPIINSDGTVTYKPNSGFTGTDVFTYRIKDQNGNYTNVATVTVKVTGFRIPNVFTPNGDGKNDTFVIVGIKDYNNAELIVFNRWGNEVFRDVNYQNTWDGGNLNEGTYYYILKLRRTGGDEVKKGWVLIKR